jgi:hypothetical protein
LDYFSSTLFTSDCFKELNDIPNIETVLQNLKDLYFIRSRILILTDDFSRLEEDKHNFIYGRLFPVEGYFLKQHKVCIEKISNSFTLRHLNDTIGLVAGRKAPVRLFLNVISVVNFRSRFLQANSSKMESRLKRALKRL